MRLIHPLTQVKYNICLKSTEPITNNYKFIRFIKTKNTMATKRKAKFDITGSADEPMNVAPYSACSINVPGAWKTANRNGNYPGDREGWGRIGVIVFVPTSGSKLCAPDPPFSTGDGFWSDVKDFFGFK